MGSSGKKKTTMAKLARESRLRERRATKQIKKDARKQRDAEGASALTADADGLPGSVVGLEPSEHPEKDAALLRLADASDDELAVFAGKLQNDALEAGASEGEMRIAQRNHPGHSD